MTSRWSAVLPIALSALWFGCTKDNPSFCCSTLESCGLVGVSSLSSCDSGGNRPFCDDTGMFGPPHTCIPDPTAPACEGTEDCTEPARPVCDTGDTGTCIGCDDASDCARFPGQTMCHPTSGACVECIGPADCSSVFEPVCGAEGACRGCQADDECQSGLCDEGSGMCIGETDILYVDRGASGVECTRASPCPTFALATPMLTTTRRFIVVAAGDYNETLALDGKTVTIVGPGASLRPDEFDVPVVRVGTGSQVRIEGMRLYAAGGNADGDGVRCMAVSGTSVLQLSGVRIDGNIGFGVDAQNCSVTIERSTISGNPGGGVSVVNGSFDITNTFITGNGGNTSIGGVRLQDNATTSRFEFNTVADNVAGGGIAKSMICIALGRQRIANNIFHSGEMTQVSQTNCDFEFNLSNMGLGGSGNITASPTFVGGGNFHLTATSEGVDAADPDATLGVDFDGDARPQGAARDIGADEVAP